MKRDMDNLDLRAAFPQEPDACHRALMQAASSVQEEKPARLAPARIILIAAILIVAMTAAAFAAARTGLMDWLMKEWNVTLPTQAQQMLSSTEQSTCQLGPLTVTITETLSDGRTTFLTATARTADGSPAVIFHSNNDPMMPVGETLATALSHPSITADTPFCEAARLSGLPFYAVMAWLQLPGDVAIETEMMEDDYQSDGSLLLIDMLSTSALPGSEMQADVYLRAYEMDPVSLEPVNSEIWQLSERRTIAIGSVSAERTYKPEGNTHLNDLMTVTEVRARQTCIGIYMTICADVAPGATLDDLFAADIMGITLLDSEGHALPLGFEAAVDLLDGSGQPFPSLDPLEITVDSVQETRLLSLDTMPESLILEGLTGAVTVK
ncbi:MAG: hypothetical protein IJX84_03535 [Clostridia bacterium]|nr:hypothetical protein [Clostridia bacterium]